MEAKFLSQDEKLVAIERLRMNQQGIASGVWKWDHVLEAMIDPKTWLWFFLLLVISYVLTLHPLNPILTCTCQHPQRRHIYVWPINHRILQL